MGHHQKLIPVGGKERVGNIDPRTAVEDAPAINGTGRQEGMDGQIVADVGLVQQVRGERDFTVPGFRAPPPAAHRETVQDSPAQKGNLLPGEPPVKPGGIPHRRGGPVRRFIGLASDP